MVKGHVRGQLSLHFGEHPAPQAVLAVLKGQR